MQVCFNTVMKIALTPKRVSGASGPPFKHCGKEYLSTVTLRAGTVMNIQKGLSNKETEFKKMEGENITACSHTLQESQNISSVLVLL